MTYDREKDIEGMARALHNKDWGGEPPVAFEDTEDREMWLDVATTAYEACEAVQIMQKQSEKAREQGGYDAAYRSKVQQFKSLVGQLLSATDQYYDDPGGLGGPDIHTRVNQALRELY